ncbi:ATPase, T2SS/T4P/T4SS family [Blastococcus sp. CT_GayMR19]|uniref:CpaF family protein n=1 Tax=Blastococcus sp. CT_GayMR19 TaxID=2559608 RepID=UPI001FD83091|nr:ATPase, T2SS/T4P/T4SS family [Blastococcus sp. CT_GayMR19]
MEAQSDDAPTSEAAELTEAEYRVVGELRDRVSTRLTAEDKNYAAGPRRELTKKLIRDEYDQWLLHEANRGRAAPTVTTEETIFSAVLAELDGLGRLAPLLARDDVEDIHFEGCDPTMLRRVDGQLVAGPPIASSDEELEQLLRSIGSRSDGGQTSREFSSASPILNVRLKGVTDLGARLQAAMDVLPRPAGVIRVHRFSDPSLDDLHRLNMVDSPVRAFLHAAIEAGVSPLVTGAPGVGKTTLLRALGNAIPWNNVVITVEDERELGLHLARWDPDQQRLVKRHAVCRPFESRLPNAEGRGGFDMGDALHLALRASPTWVLVGEVRGAYVTSLLEAATSGIASVMCTIHSPSADGVFDKVLINALKAHPPPSPELVLRSLAALGLVVHVHRDRGYSRFVSGIYELGAVGDSGRPDLKPIFAPRPEDGRAQATGAGMLSDSLAERLTAIGFDLNWLHPDASDWPTGLRRQERAS